MDSYKKRFEELLGKKAANFLASVTNASQMDHLKNCEPKSVIASALVAATLDLPIDRNLGFAHLVPYKGVCQFQMGYKGFMQLAFRTGQYKSFNDCIIPEGVFVSYNELTGDLVLNWTKQDHESDKIAGYAVFFRTNQGFEKTVFWSHAKVKAHAKRYSKSFGNASSPWQTNFDAMALKTVIKFALSKYGILSVEIQGAIIHDQGAQTDIDAKITHPDGTGPEQEIFDLPEGGVSQVDKKDEPEKGVNPDLEAQASSELPAVAKTETFDRDAVIADLKRLVGEHNTTEGAVLGYAIRAKMVPAGTTDLYATTTDNLAKLRFAVPALKGQK
jgi:recombination protein RecT